MSPGITRGGDTLLRSSSTRFSRSPPCCAHPDTHACLRPNRLPGSGHITSSFVLLLMDMGLVSRLATGNNVVVNVATQECVPGPALRSGGRVPRAGSAGSGDSGFNLPRNHWTVGQEAAPCYMPLPHHSPTPSPLPHPQLCSRALTSPHPHQCWSFSIVFSNELLPPPP